MRRWWTARPLLLAYVAVLGLLFGVLVDRKPPDAAVAAVTGGAHRTEHQDRPLWLEVFRPSVGLARRLLQQAIPGLGTQGQAEAPHPSELVVYLVTGNQPFGRYGAMRPADLAAQTNPPSAAGLPPEAASPPAEAAGPLFGPPVPEAAPQLPPPSGPIVGIYHTHDWESYVDQVSPGTDRNLMNTNDHNRSVVRVGAELAQSLKRLGIATVHSTAAHSANGYLGAYVLSRRTASEILAQYPSVKVLVDVHRDAIPREYYVTTIGGKSTAKIDIVMGEGDTDLPQPHFAQNKAWADTVCAAANAKFNGFCRGVLVKKDRYNQDLMSGAILIEVGTSTNTMAEALQSADLLAQVLADLVHQNKYPH